MKSGSCQWLLAALMVCAMPAAAQADREPNAAPPTYQIGVQPDGSIVTSTNQVLRPAGTQIVLPASRVYAVAARPDYATAAALIQSSASPIRIIDLRSNKELQEFNGGGDARGSFNGLAYSPDGSRLYASQDNGAVMVMNVAADGQVTLNTRITLPQGPYGNPDPGGLAVSPDGSRLYVALNRSNALAVIDLRTNAVISQIPVGNAPFGVVLQGGLAYVSNEGGRVAGPKDFTVPSSGTPIVADPQSGAAVTGTVSVVDLAAGKTVGAIDVGLHPTAMALDGARLFVTNSNSDSISVISTIRNRVVRTIPIHAFPRAPFGSSPNGIAVRGAYLFVTLGTNNAVAVIRWQGGEEDAALEGLIPTGSFPGSITLDPTRGTLIVGNVKGIGSLGPDQTIQGKTSHAGYADVGTISVIPAPSLRQLDDATRQVYANNGWRIHRDEAHGMAPRAIPLVRGAPSLIHHVFLVVKENRTYDQVLGDIGRGNSDPSLTVFGQQVTPNIHALATRFPLLDNFYDMGRQSADGHQWIVQSINPDYNEKESPDYVRSYPYNGGDSMTYGPTGWLWQDALRHGISTRVYGEYADIETLPPGASATWSDWYHDAQVLEGKTPGPLHLPVGALQRSTLIPSLNALLNHDFCGFDTTVPDQYRYDVFKMEFDHYVQTDTLPQLIIMTLPDDHTTGSLGSPIPAASVADNDLAVGRLVSDLSHSRYWKDSVIFVEEDDAQNGVDHVDGHRSPALVISPYARTGVVDSTYYTQVSINSTIEYILGLDPLNQFDMVAPPMSTAFTDEPDLAPYDLVPNQIPLNTLNGQSAAATPLQRAWQLFADALFRGKERTPDAVDSNQLNHAIWYVSTGFKRPYPGERAVLWPAQVKRADGPERD